MTPRLHRNRGQRPWPGQAPTTIANRIREVSPPVTRTRKYRKTSICAKNGFDAILKNIGRRNRPPSWRWGLGGGDRAGCMAESRLHGESTVRSGDARMGSVTTCLPQRAESADLGRQCHCCDHATRWRHGPAWVTAGCDRLLTPFSP